jgi:tripartite-type tricarboxylate transporter receptor subunit TctC
VFPDLPAIGEIVPGYETVAWGGVMGPANLPRDVVARLNAEIKKALASPAVQGRYKELDTEIDGGSPEEFLALAKRETVKWAEVVKRAGAKVD